MAMHVYRFYDDVAVNPPTGMGDTFYLRPAQAVALGIALIRHAADCHECKFTQSELGTFAIEAIGERGN